MDISVNKYVYFSEEFGSFFLTNEAQEIIYRQEGLICSYSGSNEWVQHFVCELLDFYSGCSIYNYALGTYRHEDELPKIFNENKEAVIRFINRSLEEPWGKMTYKMIENMIDEAESMN